MAFLTSPTGFQYPAQMVSAPGGASNPVPLGLFWSYHQQIDRRDAVGRHLCLMLRSGAAEEAAVNAGMQRLDPPIKDLWRAGVFGDLLHGDALSS